MRCPNCGLDNPSNAKFCSNCGTSFVSPPAGQQPGAYYNQTAYSQTPASQPNPVWKTVGIGCLVVALVFLALGLSCTRACFHMHRYAHHRYY